MCPQFDIKGNKWGLFLSFASPSLCQSRLEIHFMEHDIRNIMTKVYLVDF